MPNQDQITAALGDYEDSSLGLRPLDTGRILNIAIDGNAVAIAIELGFPFDGLRDELTAGLQLAVKALDGIDAVSLQLSRRIDTHAVQRNLEPLPNIRNIIAVASGKGGVGKSTVAANLALALQADGARVGMLDADIYGPSQPRMLGISGKPEVIDNKAMRPLVGHGIQTMSIGFLVDESEAMIWRGPMVTQALHQLLTETRWDDLDYLIIDLPPGTGDIHLSMAQKMPVSGAVVVTTPQDIALLDARKAVDMFSKVDVPVLGVVENMSVHVCSNCGHAESIFGTGGGEKMAADFGLPLLGALPLDISIREQADNGTPTVAADANGPIATLYRHIARSASARLAIAGVSSDDAFPEIVISDD